MSPLGTTNSEDTGAVSEFDSTTLTLTTGQAGSEEVTVGIMNLVSKAGSASLAWTYWTSMKELGYPVSDSTAVESGVQRTFDVTKGGVLRFSLVSAYVSVEYPNFDKVVEISR